MPNWNTTSVYVTGPEEQVNALYELMVSLENADKPAIENGFGNKWYGCLVNALGEDWESVRCRGSWMSLEKDSDTRLLWYDETAWGPVLEVFKLIENHFPGLKVYWLCEEPGMCIYESNDVDHKFFDVQFILYYNQCEDVEYFHSERALLDYVNLKLDYQKEIKSLKELDQYIENQEESDEMCEIAYYPFKYQDY
jgi:hypothetical protein